MAKPAVTGETVDNISDADLKIPFSLKLIGSFWSILHAFTYRKDGTVNRRLENFVESKVPANPKPVKGISSKDVTIDTANDVWVRVYTPTEQNEPKEHGSDSNPEKKLPVILQFHGGGFVSQSPDVNIFDNFARNIAKACNAVVVSVNYRRAPEFPYPTAYDDSYNALQWLRSPDSRSHLPAAADVSQCFLLGDSAGGNIVHFTGCKAAENDISPVKLRGMVELQPMYGGEELTTAEINLKAPILTLPTAHWLWKAFLPGENRDHPNCNVFGPKSRDISGLSLPPIFVAIGTLDLLKDRQTSYVKKLQEMGKDVTGVTYAGAPHGFYILNVGDLTTKVLEDVYSFIRSRTL